jgi:AraC-like DNA-binding protein
MSELIKPASNVNKVNANGTLLMVTNGHSLLQNSLENHSLRSDGEATVSNECQSEGALKIERIITYMLEHLDKPLQVAALAARASVSPSHFFVLFKRRTGCAPIDYFTRLRMQCACRLLDSTSSSVKEIADALGYGDPFYFSRVFKSVNQIAPSEYRGRQKKTQDEAGRDRTGGFFFRGDEDAKNSQPCQPGGATTRGNLQFRRH